MSTVLSLSSDNSQRHLLLGVIKRSRLEQAHRWLVRGISRYPYGSTPIAFFILMDDAVKLAFAIPPDTALDITLCKTKAAGLNNAPTRPSLLFKCDATAFARGLASAFQISGPYSLRISGDTIAVYGKGKEGFALPQIQ